MNPWDSAPDDAEVYRPALIRGQYRVIRVLHRGQRGDVVVASDNREGQDVVLKRVFEPSQEDITRLRTVHKVLSGLNNPKVMGTRELVEARADAWLVCEHCPGRGLLEWWTCLPLGQNASFRERWRHAGPIVAGLIDALEAMHTRQTAHLDMKPHNILVGRAGEVHLVDLGIWPAKEGIDTRPMAEIQERSGYSAPELMDGGKGSRRSDQWSLGAIVYELITGQKAVPGHTPAEFDRAYSVGRVQPVGEWRPEADAGVARAVERLLRWDPSARFATMSDVRDAFGDALCSAVDPPTQIWSVTRPPMVGREALDAFFRRRLLDLRSRKGCLIRVVDEAGTGKTRLLRRWARQASQDRRVQVLAASCLPERPRTALHRWFRPPPVDPKSPPPTDLVAQAMERLDQPTVLLLDALEEVDSTTWARIQRAAAIAIDGWAPKPLIIVLAGRALGGLTPFVQEGADRLFNVALPPLRPQQVSEMLRPEVETPEAREELEELVASEVERARGNPRELIQSMLDKETKGQLRRRGRVWIPQQGTTAADEFVEPPPRLDLILGYIDELGRWVEIELALAALPMARSQVLDALRWAADLDVIQFREVGGRWFMQIGNRDSRSKAELPRRSETHARAARWLERNGEFGGLAAERTAEHWHKSGEPGRAADAYARAAKSHVGIGCSSEARRLLGLARAFESRRSGQTVPGTNPMIATHPGFTHRGED
ncbi:MAG: protein kinase [Deltaproteobacteria bacterium]|nr:protein kinase [Deltaproteobacteria bacterium]